LLVSTFGGVVPVVVVVVVAVPVSIYENEENKVSFFL
jgi:hypothetical protein